MSACSSLSPSLPQRFTELALSPPSVQGLTPRLVETNDYSKNVYSPPQKKKFQFSKYFLYFGTINKNAITPHPQNGACLSHNHKDSNRFVQFPMKDYFPFRCINFTLPVWETVFLLPQSLLCCFDNFFTLSTFSWLPFAL